MAKIQIKSEKIAPFGGIYQVFSRLFHLESVKKHEESR